MISYLHARALQYITIAALMCISVLSPAFGETTALREEIFAQHYALAARSNPRIAFTNLVMLHDHAWKDVRVPPLQSRYSELARDLENYEAVDYLRDRARDLGLGLGSVRKGPISYDPTSFAWNGISALVTDNPREAIQKEIEDIGQWNQERLKGLGRAVYRASQPGADADLANMYDVARELHPTLPHPTGTVEQYLDYADPLTAAIIRKTVGGRANITWDDLTDAIKTEAGADKIINVTLPTDEDAMDAILTVSNPESGASIISDAMAPFEKTYAELSEQFDLPILEDQGSGRTEDPKIMIEKFRSLQSSAGSLSRIATMAGEQELARGFTAMEQVFGIATNVLSFYTAPDPLTRVGAGLGVIEGTLGFLKVGTQPAGPPGDPRVTQILQNQRVILDSLERIEVGIGEIRRALFDQARLGQARYHEVRATLLEVLAHIEDVHSTVANALRRIDMVGVTITEQEPLAAAEVLRIYAQDPHNQPLGEVLVNELDARFHVTTKFSDITSFIINATAAAPHIKAIERDAKTFDYEDVFSMPWAYGEYFAGAAIDALKAFHNAEREAVSSCRRSARSGPWKPAMEVADKAFLEAYVSPNAAPVNNLEELLERSPPPNLIAISDWNTRLADLIARFNGTTVQVNTGSVCSATTSAMEAWGRVYEAGYFSAYTLKPAVNNLFSHWLNVIREEAESSIGRDVSGLVKSRIPVMQMVALLSLPADARDYVVECVIEDCDLNNRSGKLADEAREFFSTHELDRVGLLKEVRLSRFGHTMIVPALHLKDNLIYFEDNKTLKVCYTLAKSVSVTPEVASEYAHLLEDYLTAYGDLAIEIKKLCFLYEPLQFPEVLGVHKGELAKDYILRVWNAYFVKEASAYFEGKAASGLIKKVTVEEKKALGRKNADRVLSELVLGQLERLEASVSRRLKSDAAINEFAKHLDEAHQLAVLAAAHLEPSCFANETLEQVLAVGGSVPSHASALRKFAIYGNTSAFANQIFLLKKQSEPKTEDDRRNEIQDPDTCASPYTAMPVECIIRAGANSEESLALLGAAEGMLTAGITQQCTSSLLSLKGRQPIASLGDNMTSNWIRESP